MANAKFTVYTLKGEWREFFGHFYIGLSAKGAANVTLRIFLGL